MRRTLIASAFLGCSAGQTAAAQWHVGADHSLKSVTAAVEAAAEGDTILVHSGRYAEGNIRIGKRLTLQGIDFPILDGRGTAEVLTIAASNVSVSGFQVENTGRSSTQDRAGIRVDTAKHVTVTGNRLRHCHFAIYLGRAAECEVLHNEIQGDPDIEQNCGNGIHLWNCASIQLKGNTIQGHRDGIYLEFASHSDVEDNLVSKNLRYGLHFMYSHDSSYRKNRFTDNGAGVAVMYSRHVQMIDNRFDYNWGSSSYGLLLKDITDSAISGNVFDHNSTAVYAQGASRLRMEGNAFQQNGWALRILASGDSNVVAGNNFTGNSFDIATNGDLSNHEFAGNFWDRYEGYDLNRDGVGDVPFHPVSLYAMLVEKVPPSVLLMRSFMSHLLDRAEKAFPSVTPDTVVDNSPSWRPHKLTQDQAAPTASSISQPKHNPTSMKLSNLIYLSLLTGLVLLTTQCEKQAAPAKPAQGTAAAPSAPGTGQSGVVDNTSEKDVVKVAVGSPDHTTLVKAVQAAELVDVLSNAGPFTVFAPTNAAFDKLPAGTVQDLLKPENKEKLQDVLQYHVAVGGFRTEMLKDGMVLDMANGGKATVAVKDGKITVQGATIVGTVKASNGIVHVVDAVMLAPAAK
jgi:nitrous oxidase accessory protein